MISLVPLRVWKISAPLSSPQRRNPNGIDCKWHRKQNKRGVPTAMYEELQQWIDESRRIVFFGGAGVSTESGIPDFRSQDGLYHQQFAYPPEEILSHTFFARHPEEFYRFYRAKMLPLDAQPNDAHRFLAQLEAGGRLTAVITQNIDGLHQKAGSKTVLELHGSIHRNYCLKCARFFRRSTSGTVKACRNAPAAESSSRTLCCTRKGLMMRQFARRCVNCSRRNCLSSQERA